MGSLSGRLTGRICNSISASSLPCALALVLLLSGVTSGQLLDETVESQVKAAFLLNFTKFVDWPASSFAAPDSPLAICVLGKDPFGGALDDVVRGEAVGSHRLIVRRIRQAPAPHTCQVLFVSAGEKLPDGAVRGVLTVGEGDRFLREGGMIAMVIDNRKVRFDINQAATTNAGLSLSSRLLEVARSVQK